MSKAQSYFIFFLLFLCIQNINPSVLQHAPSMLPSEGLVDDIIVMDATAVHSADGEVLTLLDKVWL